MGQQVLIDTDILIDFGRNNAVAVQTIATLEQNFELCASIIVAMELYAGSRSKEDLKGIDDLLGNLKLYDITKQISENAFRWMGEYRASHGVEINDMLIASTAHIHEMSLISKNQKHYRFLSELDLLKYPLER